MAEQENWGLSREEIAERLQKLNQEKKEPTRGGRSSGQGVKPVSTKGQFFRHIESASLLKKVVSRDAL